MRGANMSNNNQGVSSALSNARRGSAQAQRCVLVVDDNSSILDMLGSALSLIGFQVVKAADGKQAYESFLNHSVDLVITDVQMPVMDGLALTERINRHSPHIPVVIVTGHGWLPDEDCDTQLSVFAVLNKPFRLDKLQHIALKAVDQRLERVGESFYESTH
jgi:DNA-binding NtrC family response regulator